jgi:predicted O-methyltransferase YrrM
MSGAPSGNEATAYNFTEDWFSVNIPVWTALIDQIQPARILEIGSFEGRSAVFVIERCAAARPIELYCVDTWAGGVEHVGKQNMSAVEQRFDQNIEAARDRARHPTAMHKIKENSFSALTGLLAAGMTGKFDFIYIDGSHQAADVLADAVLSYALLRVGGALAFDDYLWSMEENGRQDPLNMPKPAIDAFVNIYQRRVRVVAGTPIHQLYLIKER